MDRRNFFGACASASTALTVQPGSPPKSFDMWCIVELMGHVRMAGRVTEEERFGSKMGRIDIPTEDGGFVTQYFTAASVYRITPTTEDAARKVQMINAMPIAPYEWEQSPRRAVEYEDDGPEVLGYLERTGREEF